MKNLSVHTKHFFQIAFLLFATFFGTMAQAQIKQYIAKGPEGQQVFTQDSTRILVSFQATLSADERATLVRGISPYLIYDKHLEFPQLDATVLQVSPGVSSNSVFQLLEQLNQSDALKYAAPFLLFRDGSRQGILNELNIGLKNTDDLAWLESVCKNEGLSAPVPNEFDAQVFSVKVPDNRMGRALEIANRVYESGVVAFAEVNFLMIMKPHNTNDPLQITQWSQDNTGKYWNGSAWVYVGSVDADMDIEEAWGISTGSATVKVAVIDEGVDMAHPDLVGNMLAGYDATGGGSGGNPSNDDNHGTACAGIIAAKANNNLGLAGNAYNCKIVPVRIAYTPVGQTNWYTTTTWQANGINWAWQTGGASVLSNSWGGGSPSSIVSAAITNAVTNGRSGKGSPVLFSAGNDNTAPVSYPSYYSNTISVGASSNCDTRKSTTSCDGEYWWGSNYGTGLDITAPGVKITTTDIAGWAGSSTGDYLYNFNGTSAACPNAAAVMALILSVNPALTQTQARAILESTCQKVGGYSYTTTSGQPNGTWTSQMGYGRVNALAALQAAQGGGSSCAAPTTSQMSVTNITSTAARLNCSVSGVQAYDWRYRQLGASSWTDLTSTTNNYVNISGLVSGTQYEFSAAVRCGTTNWSTWSASKSFSTTGSSVTNDNPCNATLIYANNSCTYLGGTTVGATASFNDQVCSSTSPKDVWFKCAIPSSGFVTFRTAAGTLTDALMAVYWNSCSNLTYIACEDDNTNGNGSLMPVIAITGQAGTMLWIRIWGYENAAGSFNICAINYNSSNITGGNEEEETVVYAINDENTANTVVSTQKGIDQLLSDERSNAHLILSNTAMVGDVFPNPAKNKVVLPYTLTQPGTVQITICDPLGRLIETYQIDRDAGDYAEHLDLEHLISGSYFIRFQSGQTTRVQQLKVK